MSRCRTRRAWMSRLCCCGKATLDTQSQAERVLSECQAAAARGVRRRREPRIYPCPTSDVWHLTSQPDHDPEQEDKAS